MNHDSFMQRRHRKDWVWKDPYGVYCEFQSPRGPGTRWTKTFKDRSEAGEYAIAADKVFNLEVTICEQGVGDGAKEKEGNEEEN
jgi:hypothetical protein